MIRYKNLVIIGTSHISIDSVKKVEKVIVQEKPEIVALELDPQRYQALLQKSTSRPSIKDIKQIGIKGFLFNLAGAYIEKKLGELVNTPPGSEMKKAIASARIVNADLAFIDQDIRLTLKRLSKRITWKEKYFFVTDLIKGMIIGKKININLKKVPSKKTVKWLTQKIKKRYPSIYQTLITERDEIMAKKLKYLMGTNKRIVAVVGIGHEEGIIKFIKATNNIKLEGI